MSPIARTPALMRNCCNENVILAKPVEERVRKSIQHEAALTAPADWVSQWCFQDLLDRVVELERECLRGDFAARLVPFTRFGELLVRFGMEP